MASLGRVLALCVCVCACAGMAGAGPHRPRHGAGGGTASPYLNPVLQFASGQPVTRATWPARRAEMLDLVTHTILGTLPDTRAELLPDKSRVVNSTVDPVRQSRTTHMLLTYRVPPSENPSAPELTLPIVVYSPLGDGPFPVFLTQWNHLSWALLGLSRGYVAVIYPGADTRDAAPSFQHAHRNATMALIAARAYVASLVLDYVLTLPQVHTEQVAITGHSRNGKQSLIAAAIDERITAVVGSSPGAPISSPYHFSSANFYGEGPVTGGVAGFWWLESIKQYAAHPETLPADGHFVTALIAPRACAFATGMQDHEGDTTFADESNIKEAMHAFELLDAPDKLRIIHRPGDHHGFDDVNTYFDWFDHSFGRLTPGFSLSWSGAAPFPLTYLTAANFDWDVWNASVGALVPAPPPKAAPLAERIRWLIGMSEDTPSRLSPGSSYAEETSEFTYISDMLHHNVWSGLHREPVSFGDYVTGNVYWNPKKVSASPPAVVWLHPYSYATGYSTSYGQANVWEDLADAGFVVLAYDQVGFGIRLPDGGTNFYARHGARSSLFGHMVKDTLAAVDFFYCRSKAGRANATCDTGEVFTPTYANHLTEIPEIDLDRVFVMGYSLGGNVALHAASLDPRIRAVGAFAAFTPFGTDTLDKPTGGIKRLYDLHGVLPNLGFFQNNPAEVPYDYDELLASLAPRPTLLYTPEQDRDATYTDVVAAISTAAKAWAGHAGRLNHTSSPDYTHMASAQSAVAVAWATSVAAGL